MLRAGGVGKLLAALVPFWVLLSLHSCRVWGRYKAWILPFAESGLLPYQCSKVHDNSSFVSNHLLIKLTCLELINEWDFIWAVNKPWWASACWKWHPHQKNPRLFTALLCKDWSLGHPVSSHIINYKLLSPSRHCTKEGQCVTCELNSRTVSIWH